MRKRNRRVEADKVHRLFRIERSVARREKSKQVKLKVSARRQLLSIKKAKTRYNGRRPGETLFIPRYTTRD